MTSRSFGHTIMYGAIAAAVVLFIQALAASTFEMVFVLSSLAAIYVGGLGETPAAKVGGFALAWTALLAIGLVFPVDLLFLAAVTTCIGLARSAMKSDPRPLRRIVLEGGIAGLSWFLIFLFHSEGILELPLIVWAFFLGQSGFYLIGDRPVDTSMPSFDSFEAAHRRAMRLLERI